MNTEQVWNYLEDHEIATNEELVLITNINGYSVETLESVIYARTGYNSIDQLIEEDNDE